MRPRIFLSREDMDYTSRLYNDLNDVNRLELDLENQHFFLHIGFNPVLADTLRANLSAMPAGLYCSRTFVNAEPGIAWEFSEELVSQKCNCEIYYVNKSSIENFFPNEQTFELIKQFVRKRANEPELNNTAEIVDEYLSEYQWSVRTTNVFERANIERLSQLMAYTEQDLLSIRNFGRTSLREVKKFLENRGLNLGFGAKSDVNSEKYSSVSGKTIAPTRSEYKLSSDTDFFDDIDASLLSTCTSREYDIIAHRSGLQGVMTLEELALEYGITRERIRQIEKKGLSRIFRNRSNSFHAWYSVFLNLVDNAHLSIPVDDFGTIDERFRGGQSVSDLVRYVIYFVNRLEKRAPPKGLNGIRHRGRLYLFRVDDETHDFLKQKLKEVMQSIGECAVTKIKRQMSTYLSPASEGLFELLLNEQLQKSIIKQGENGETIFIRFAKRSKIELGKDYLIEKIELSDKPIDTYKLKSMLESSDIDVSFTSVMNSMNSSEDIFPTRHGSWGSFRHIKFSNKEKNMILREAEAFCAKGPDVQFHSREIKGQLSEILNDDLTEFGITAILNKYGNYTYLGRNAFGPKNSQLEKRVFVNDMMIRVLREHDRPMHANELIVETKKYVSVDDNIMVQVKAPMINIGQNTFALDYWDDHKLGQLPTRNS